MEFDQVIKNLKAGLYFKIMSSLKVNFEDDSRGKYLELLGYRKEDLGKKVNFWES